MKNISVIKIEKESFVVLLPVIMMLQVLLLLMNNVQAQSPKQVPFEMRKGMNLSAWLSQNKFKSDAEREAYFTEADFKELKALGFDHIRLPVAEINIYDENGNPKAEVMKLIHRTIEWCRDADMHIILDCHQTRDHDFSKYSSIVLFNDPNSLPRFIDLWSRLSDEFGKYPNTLLAYELLNEPNAKENQSWNNIALPLIKEIRKKEPERIILLGSNKANRVSTFTDLRVPKKDPNIILSFHFYYPYLLTHFNSDSYKSLKVIKGPLIYPGQIVPDSVVATLDDNAKKVLENHNGVFNKEVLYQMIQPVIQKAKDSDLRLHCGEFGVNFQYPDQPMLTRYIEDLVSIFKEHGIAYTVWGYRKQFGVFDDNRKIKDQRYLDAIVK
ncbi:MAG: glycoside hydrolase family 5 protein [Niabella sp.]